MAQSVKLLFKLLSFVYKLWLLVDKKNDYTDAQYLSRLEGISSWIF